MNKLINILDYLWEDAQQPDTGSGRWKPDRMRKAEAAINKYISENYIPKSNFDKALAIAEHTGYEHAVKDYKDVEQRKRAGITVDGENKDV